MRHLRPQENTSAIILAIDPRIRLLAAGLLLGLVVSSTGSAFPWLVAGLCLPAARLSGMTLRVLSLRLLHPLFIIVMILALKVFLGAGEPFILFQTGAYVVMAHREGLHEGLLIVSRVMGA